MAQSRVQSLKDEDTYKALIKTHLQDPRHTTKHWNSSDLDFVVGHHVKFLCAVALTGCSLNETILTKCLRDMFASSRQECQDCAHKLAEALSYCRSKAKPGRVTSGAKTNAAVKEVIAAIKSGHGDKELSPSPQHQPSSVAAQSDVVEICSTPPRKQLNGDDDDVSQAFKMLQEAFTEESSAAAPSKPSRLMDSPVSIASSASPPRSASSSMVPALPTNQVQLGVGP